MTRRSQHLTDSTGIGTGRSAMQLHKGPDAIWLVLLAGAIGLLLAASFTVGAVNAAAGDPEFNRASYSFELEENTGRGWQTPI